jgi:hypothetical protein
MPRLNFIHVCESAFRTDGNKNLNVIGIFDTISSFGFPAIHPKFTVVANLEADNNGPHKTSLVILRSDTREKLSEMETSFVGIRQQIIHTFINFQFPAEGSYLIEISLDNIFLGSATIILRKV